MSSTTSELISQTIVVRAGAGAGKTTELIRRVLGFIQKTQQTEDRDPKLSLTTFTRKATQEIRERLVESALQSGDARLVRYVQQSRSLHISTIHGTLRRYLSQYGSVVGLAPDFSLIDVAGEQRLLKKNLRRLLRTQPEIASQVQAVLEEWDLSTFISAFREWVANEVRFPDSRGLGRDEIVAEQVSRLSEIDALARDLRDTLNREGAEKSWAQLLDWLNNILLTPGRSMETWLRADQDRPSVRKLKTTSETVVELKDQLFDALDELGDWNWTAEFAEKSEILKTSFMTTARALNEALWQEKIRRGQLTMNDLEVVSLKLIKEFPATAEKFSASWDFWLIDEYQDTSPLQVEILRGLVGRGKEFVVGDPQQSIYLFRGARSEVFLEKERHATRVGGELVSLKKNYRSSPKLMQFLNHFLTDFSEQLSAMEIAREDDGSWPHPSALFWQVPLANIEAAGASAKKAIRADEREAMDLAVIERAQELIAHGVAPEKICILARRNSDLERLAQKALDWGLPAHLHASSQYASRREVRDALSFLRFLANPHDNINLVELLRSPWFPVEDAFLAELGHRGSQSYWARWQTDAQLQSQFQDSRRLLRDALEASESSGIGSVWQRTLIERGLVDWSYAIDPSGRREGNLWKFATELRLAERQAGFSYTDFLREMEVGGSTDEDQGEAEAPTVIEPQKINLMTIHASKGLQFDHVLVPDVGADPQIKIRKRAFLADEKTGTWALSLKDPGSGSWACPRWATTHLEAFKSREQAECDRLLYVALTRAKQSVSLIWSEVRRNSWAERFVPRLGSYASMIDRRDREPQPQKGVGEKQAAVSVRAPWNLVLPSFARPQVSHLDAKLPDVRALEKIQHGIEIHRRMEALKVNWQDVQAEHLRNRLGEESVDMKYLIQNGFVEWSFLVRLPELLGEARQFLQGRIDLWGFDEQGEAWIVDYKSGDIRYVDKAIRQLKIYAWSLYTLGVVKADRTIRLLPIFIDEKPLAAVSVSSEALRNELAALLAEV